jgi:hypothetical protein
MKKITLLILSITILNGCQSYFEADSKLFESSISRDLNLNEYDLIVKCQHGSLVSELNVEFVNGECVLTKDNFFFFVQEPTTLEHRLAHKINVRDIKSFGLIDATSSFRSDLKMTQLQIRGTSFTYVNNMKTDDAIFFAQSLRLLKINEIQPAIKIMPQLPNNPTSINIIIPSKK